MTPTRNTATPAAPAASPALTAQVETITPDLAAEWLGRNSHNRTLRNRQVENLAGAITRGEWRLNGDAIRFATDGSLLDGQHRLWAIVEADTPVESMVIRGLPRETMTTIDVGARRSLTDALRLRGEGQASLLAATLSYFWRMEEGLVRLPGARPTIPQALALLEEHPNLRETTKVGHNLNRRFRVSSAMVGALAYQLDAIDSDAATEFFRLLEAGTRLEEGSPILVLRRWMEVQSVSAVGARANALTTHALIIKAWNAWRQGIHVQRLNWKASGSKVEPFPEPF